MGVWDKGSEDTKLLMYRHSWRLFEHIPNVCLFHSLLVKSKTSSLGDTFYKCHIIRISQLRDAELMKFCCTLNTVLYCDTHLATSSPWIDDTLLVKKWDTASKILRYLQQIRECDSGVVWTPACQVWTKKQLAKYIMMFLSYSWKQHGCVCVCVFVHACVSVRTTWFKICKLAGSSINMLIQQYTNHIFTQL
jgi:hypothetical protein